MSECTKCGKHIFNPTHDRIEVCNQCALSELAPASGSAFEHAKYNDVTVHRMLREGAGLEAIIGQLAADKDHYMKRIMELESIAPRKIALPDGRVMMWHCPDEFVPEMSNS